MHHHAHDHDGHHHHHHHGPISHEDINNALIWGIVLNGLYVVLQVVMGFRTHSVSLLSDAGHNFGDVAGLALSLFSFKLVHIKANSKFSYGYKKTTILAALSNAVILLVSVGALGFESFKKIMSPTEVHGGSVALVAGGGIAINFLSAMLLYRKKDHDLNTKGAYLHLLSDALVSMGVVVGGIIIEYTHIYWIDGAISIGILFFILLSTWHLLKHSLKMSLDGVPEGIEMSGIEAEMLKVEGVEGVHHMHIWAMSTTENALTTHIVVNERLNFKEQMSAIQDLKHRLLHMNIHHATIEIESISCPCGENGC